MALVALAEDLCLIPSTPRWLVTIGNSSCGDLTLQAAGMSMVHIHTKMQTEHSYT